MTGTDSLYARLGDLVRLHRKRIGVTQAEVGKRIGLSRTSITNIEKGRQKILLHQLYDIATALQTTPESLLPPSHEIATRVTDLQHQVVPPEAGSEAAKEWFIRVVRSSTD